MLCVNTYSTINQRVPAVGVDAVGDFVLAWESYGQDGSNFGITSSSVTGAVTIGGSSAVSLDNAFCGGAALSGSGNVLLENRALAPLAAPQEGC